MKLYRIDVCHTNITLYIYIYIYIRIAFGIMRFHVTAVGFGTYYVDTGALL
jgi:hypothetical protein